LINFLRTMESGCEEIYLLNKSQSRKHGCEDMETTRHMTWTQRHTIFKR